MNIAELDRLDKRLIDLEGATFQRVRVMDLECGGPRDCSGTATGCKHCAPGDTSYLLRVKWYGEQVIVSNEEELLTWLDRRKRRAQALGHRNIVIQAALALEGSEYE